MHAFIPGNELVRGRETGHQATLLQPEDGTEGTGEKYAFDRRKSDQTLGK